MKKNYIIVLVLSMLLGITSCTRLFHLSLDKGT